MAWTRLTNSTTANADHVHNNFTLIRSGDLLPVKLSDTASYTTGSYDIGSATYKWNRIYGNRCFINGLNDLIFNTTTADTVTSISISNSDSVTSYKVKMDLIFSAAAAGSIEIGLVFNSDSSSSYKSLISKLGVANTTLSLATDLRVLSINATSAAYKIHADLDIKTRSEICLLAGRISIYNTAGVDNNFYTGGRWLTTTGDLPTVTSIKITTNIAILTGSSIMVWRNKY